MICKNRKTDTRLFGGGGGPSFYFCKKGRDLLRHLCGKKMKIDFIEEGEERRSGSLGKDRERISRDKDAMKAGKWRFLETAIPWKSRRRK